MHGPGALTLRLLLAAGLALGVATPVYAVPASAAGAAAPALEPLRVVPGGQEATLDVRASEPVAVEVDVRAETPPGAGPGPEGKIGVRHTAVAPAGAFNALTDGVTFFGPAAAVPAEPVFAATHHLKLPGLSAATSYSLSVTATNRAGQETTTNATFVTLKRRVRVSLREITITDDGDFIGDGEPVWTAGVGGADGAVAGCFPNTDVGRGGVCQSGSYGEGRIFPRNDHGQVLTWLFAEESFDQFPQSFTLSARADEEDLPFVPCVPCGFGGTDTSEWPIPAGVEWASTPVFLRANSSNGGLASTMAFTFELFHDNLSYPSERNAPASTWRAPFGSRGRRCIRTICTSWPGSATRSISGRPRCAASSARPAAPDPPARAAPRSGRGGRLRLQSPARRRRRVRRPRAHHLTRRPRERGGRAPGATAPTEGGSRSGWPPYRPG